VNEKPLRIGIGLRVAMLRKSREWSQGEVAKACNLSTSSVSRIEAGACFPTIPAILRLSDAFDVEPSKLLPDLEDVRTAMKGVRRHEGT